MKKLVKVIKSTCGVCQMTWGILISFEGNKPIRIEGDPENPVNMGILCVKGQAALGLCSGRQEKEFPFFHQR
jgi:anaerobic selenocysteine-containing dehydrogenase